MIKERDSIALKSQEALQADRQICKIGNRACQKGQAINKQEIDKFQLKRDMIITTITRVRWASRKYPNLDLTKLREIIKGNERSLLSMACTALGRLLGC